MKHLLESPAWHALNSGNQDLAFGNDKVKFFAKELSPFVGLAENTPENFQVLYDTRPQIEPALFMTPVEISIPEQWEVLHLVKAIQMISENTPPAIEATSELVPLTDVHISQMLELTKLTNPGPFSERTIDFGHYRGIFEGDQLAAMAGQRLHAGNYAEISAVCTHPDHTSKGYAKQLLMYHIERIRAASKIPYLHVRADNARAIKVYESLGFVKSRDMYFYVLKKV
jgi:ribosomal protein S18 acetylase RimI-like enzyme